MRTESVDREAPLGFIRIGRCAGGSSFVAFSQHEPARVDDRRSRPDPVRDHVDLPLLVRAADARAGAAGRDHADALVPLGRRGVAAADALLRDAAPDQLRDRGRDRARPGVRVRDELVGVLEVRRQRVRRAARDRGAGRVHARVDVPRALDLRLEPALAPPPSRDDLDRRARVVAVGLLHPGRELVDAAPGRVHARQADGRGPPHERLGPAVERVRAPGLPAHDARRADLRIDRDARCLQLALPARPRRRALPPRREAGPDRRGARHVAPARRRQPLRGSGHERPGDEDRRFRGAVEHLPAMRLLCLPDRGLHGGRPDTGLLDHDPASSLVHGDWLVRRPGPGPQPAPGPGAEQVRRRQLHAERPGHLLVDAGHGLHGRADVPRGRGRRVAVPEAEARDGALVPVDRARRDRVPVHRRDRRLDPHRDGPAAVDRPGSAQDRPGELAEREHGVDRVQPHGVHQPLRHPRSRRLRAHAALRAARPAADARGAPRAGGDVLDGPPDYLVHPDHRSLERLLPARGLRLRRRHAAAVRPAERIRARGDVRVDRARLGRERGLARGRGRRDLRGVPGLVRDDVLGLLPRASAPPLLPDHPRRLVRVAREGREPTLARRVALGKRDRQHRHRAHLGHRAREPDPRGADRGERRLRRELRRPVHSVHRVRRDRVRAPLRVPRRELPRAPHQRRPARGCRFRSEEARAPRGDRRRGVSDLDDRRRDRPQRQGRVPGRRAGRARDRGSCAGGGLRARGQERAGVHDDGARGGRFRRDAVHGALPAGDGLQPELRKQPRRVRRGLGPLHAGRDDRRRADRDADRAALPELDLLRLPGTNLRRGDSPARGSDRTDGRLGGELMRVLDRRLVRRAAPVRPLLVLDTMLGAASAALVLVQAVLIARIVARAFDGAPLGEVTFDLVLLALAYAGRSILTWGFEVAGRRAASTMLSELRLELVERRLRSESLALDGAEAGEITATAVQGVEGLEVYFARYLPQVVLAIVIPVAVLGLAVAVDPISAALMLITLPLVPVFMWLIGRYTEERTRERWLALRLLSTHFLDVVRGLPTLRLFNQSRAQAATIDDVSDRHRRATAETLRVSFLSGTVLELAATLGVALVAVTVGVRLVGGSLGLQAGLTVLVLAPELYLPLRQLGAEFHASADGLAVAERIIALTEIPPEVSRNPGIPAPSPAGELILFESVSFAYPSRQGLVLEELDLELFPGETLLLGGPSGAGKSTVASLLLRLAEPTSGRLTVGGVDLAGCDTDDWRRNLAWVPQRPTIFHGTVSDNIRLARAEPTDAEVRAAAVVAGADRFVQALPAGYETVVGDGGRPLSAGERRRLALARAFVRDAPLVILDEPTADLDHASTELVADAVEMLREGRTVLLIAHRPELATHADRIVVLEAGKVAVLHERRAA